MDFANIPTSTARNVRSSSQSIGPGGSVASGESRGDERRSHGSEQKTEQCHSDNDEYETFPVHDLSERHPHQPHAQEKKHAAEDPVGLVVLEDGDREGATAYNDEEVAEGSAPTATSCFPTVFQHGIPPNLTV
jgi:hypothetical protein